MVITDRDSESKAEVVRTLIEQLAIEGQFVGLYEENERASENKAMKRVMQMFRLDSQRHINILQAAIEIIQGEEVFIEDRGPLKETFNKHLELEAEALKKAKGWTRLCHLFVDDLDEFEYEDDLDEDDED